jgi:hypothetical protein
MLKLKYKKFIAGFFITILTASLAQASITKFFTINKQGQLMADEPDFNKDITKITEAIDNYKISEVSVNVVIKPESDNASFDSGSIVEVPRTMVMYNHIGSNPDYKTTIDALAVYAHEYGHAVFDAHISAAIPAYEEMKRLKREISMRSLRPFNERLTHQQGEANQKRIKELTDSLLANKEILRMARLTLPYHEVFADTIAVFVFNSKNAIHQALYYNDMSDRDNGFSGGGFGRGFGPPTDHYNPHDPNINIIGRDFSVVHDVNTWSNNSEHSLFSPLRSVIGSDQCWPTTDADRATKLKLLLKILLADLVEKNKAKTFPKVIDNKKIMDAYKAVCK